MPVQPEPGTTYTRSMLGGDALAMGSDAVGAGRQMATSWTCPVGDVHVLMRTVGGGACLCLARALLPSAFTWRLALAHAPKAMRLPITSSLIQGAKKAQKAFSRRTQII
jgi:hypothetical protein